MKNVRVHSWEEFKRLAIKNKPKCIVYIIAHAIPTSDLTALKLLLPVQGIQYIFTDTAKGDKLRRTGIRIHTDKKGNARAYIPIKLLAIKIFSIYNLIFWRITVET